MAIKSIRKENFGYQKYMTINSILTVHENQECSHLNLLIFINILIIILHIKSSNKIFDNFRRI